MEEEATLRDLRQAHHFTQETIAEFPNRQPVIVSFADITEAGTLKPKSKKRIATA